MRSQKYRLSVTIIRKSHREVEGRRYLFYERVRSFSGIGSQSQCHLLLSNLVPIDWVICFVLFRCVRIVNKLRSWSLRGSRNVVEIDAEERAGFEGSRAGAGTRFQAGGIKARSSLVHQQRILLGRDEGR